MQEVWDKLFDELYLKTYAAVQTPELALPMALGAVKLAGLEPGADVLDAACGFGRHSIPLAEAGYRVVGADRSAVLLAEARRRAGEREWPRWVEADYRELPFDDASFDVVLNLFTSFGFYGEEGDAQALREFLRVLRPDGRLVIEIMHRDRLIEIYQERSWTELPDGATLLEERKLDPVTGFVETMHKYAPEKGAPTAVTYRLRVYTATELGRLVEDAGFAALEFHGDLEGAPLSRETRLVIVAQKPAQ